MKVMIVEQIVFNIIIEHCEDSTTGRQCVCNTGFGGNTCTEPICTDLSMCGSHGIFQIIF